MFEKTLADVVKGIRACKRDTALYISQCIAEIKTEINSSDMHVKANALQKLTFLQMMGYSMSWASFASIEVMSSPRFAHKRVGYLAASQGFTQDTDVILLTTNLLKKELRGAVGGGMHGVYEAGLAVNCISNIVTAELACDLLPELTNLTSHPQPYLRKKAILCLFKLFVKYPQALRLTFPKIQQCVQQDPDSSAISCAVNVITELSDKNPKNYLHMAPAFFELLTKSSNNWMLIKVVKLLGSLVPEEPRLARKLLEPLANIVRNTQAKSLLYEAVYAITLCLPYCRKNDGSMPSIVPDIVVLCAQTLRDLVEQEDQNLKYLGLVGFGSLMQSHPRVLSAPDYRPLILECLSDQDVTIRSRALELLTGMTSRKNIVELVTQLLDHVALATGTYKHDLVAKIVAMCSRDKYALLQDFAWYLDVLFRIGHMRGVERHGDLLRSQVTDVALRVLPVRPYAVRRSIEILLEREVRVSDDPYGDNGRGKHIMPSILPALAWIIGEYSELIREAISSRDDGKDFSFDQNSLGTYHAIIQVLTDPEKILKLPPSTQKVYVQAAMKVLAAASADGKVKNAELEACLQTIQAGLSLYTQSTDVEVLDRAFLSLELLKSLELAQNPLDASPDLTSLSDDDSDNEDDLLGMGGAAGSDTKSTSMPKGQGSLASRLRDASTTLNYILKPTPMKPIGAKVQKKKRDSAFGTVEAPKHAVDLNVFREFIDEEVAYRQKGKLTMESVCFTQQQPLKNEERPAIQVSDETFMTSQGGLPSLHMAPESSTSFQKPPGGFVPSTTTTARPRQGDPFYLDSGPANTTEDDRGLNRFGTIQLGDSDEEQDRRKKARKKKEKKEKRSKQNDTLLLSGIESPTPAFERAASVEVYNSDEEEEDEDMATKTQQARKKGPGKEFASLAQVDLTTPLREDEVMPERKHHVVSEIKKEAPTSAPKHKKKGKKAKKAKAAKDQSAEVGDLLDLGGFGGSRATGAVEPSATARQQPSNPINAAFDDLLGLEMPTAPELPSMPGFSAAAAALAPTQSAFEEIGTAPEKASKRPWLKGSIKSPSGSVSSIDWSAVHLRYRAYRTSQGDGLGAMLSFCVNNKSSAQLSNLSLSFKGISSVQMGSIAPGGMGETEKIGPFLFSGTDDSQDVKGSLQTSEGSVNVKIVLPASFHLRPEENLTLDQIAQELASPGWSSHSSKIDIAGSIEVADVKPMLCSFLRATEVNETTGNSSSGTFACRSKSGARVRILVKLKERSVKVDVKATNSALGKAIASDIKRILL